MEIFIVLIILLILWLSFKYLLSPNKYKNLPPGPRGLPFFGSLFFLKPRLYIALQRLGQQYGPVFKIRLGLMDRIVLHSFEAVKEALVTQGQIFTGRTKSDFVHHFVRNQGILQTDGEHWKRQRRSALQILKDFGFGREGSKEIIQNEIEDAIRILDSRQGKPIDTQHFFGDCTANVINAICVNERPAHVDQEFQHVLKCFDRLVQLTVFDQLPAIFPFLMKLPIISNYMIKNSNRQEIQDTVFNYIKKKIAAHKQNFDPEQEPKDFIDAMLVLEKEAKVSEPGYNAATYEFRICRTVFELFIAGNDTTATTLSWMFVLLSLHPDILKKAQQEIDTVCEKNSPIRVEMKKLLPYTCAVIDEVTRFASIVPISLPHRCLSDTKVLGFDIPAETIVFPHIYGVHHDSSYWEKPNDFYPEHFLSKEGKVYTPREHLIPFSMGPRTCMGEILANLELFLIAASIIREFDVKLDGHYSQQKIEELLMGRDGGVRRIGQHKLVFTRRK